MEKSSALIPIKAEESYPRFTLSSLGFGPSAPSKSPPRRLPPPVEVFLSKEESSGLEANVDPIIIHDGLTLLKGRVSTFDVFGVANSDLVPGKYEGGLKLWEGSIDLIKILQSEVREGKLVFKGKHVLELGCGHGLPGIFAGLEGAEAIHFQDFNAEVLRSLTIPNVNANLEKTLNQHQTLLTSKNTRGSSPVRFFAGDWDEVHQLLPCGCYGDQQNIINASPEGNSSDGYDIILMAETVYSLSSLESLYGLIKKSMHRPSGVVYMAGKKHYFGVGGGTRRFVNLVEEDGVMTACLLAEVADGASNVREVWKFIFK